MTRLALCIAETTQSYSAMLKQFANYPRGLRSSSYFGAAEKRLHTSRIRSRPAMATRTEKGPQAVNVPPAQARPCLRDIDFVSLQGIPSCLLGKAAR